MARIYPHAEGRRVARQAAASCDAAPTWCRDCQPKPAVPGENENAKRLNTQGRNASDYPATASQRLLAWHTAYDGAYHTPLGRFSKLDCSTIKRVPIPNDTSLEALGEMFPTPTFLAPILFQPWRYRWKIGPGWCDIHHRIRVRANIEMLPRPLDIS